MIGGLILMSAGALAFGKVIFVTGATAFATLLLFQLITLPVEFNASAKALIVEAGIVNQQEVNGVAKVLNAAAMTFVAAL